LRSGRGPGATFAIHWSRRHRFGSVPLVSVRPSPGQNGRAPDPWKSTPRGCPDRVAGAKTMPTPRPPDGRTAVPPGRYGLGKQSITAPSERIGKSR
jgi:hypothetical protein